MWEHDVRQVFARLPKSAMPFDYFKDRYALMLLRDALPGEVPIRALRASRYARLLERPPVEALIRANGNGRLGPADLERARSDRILSYELTLGLWGPRRRRHWDRSKHQMLRPGRNLVLQLNFSATDVRDYRSLVQPKRIYLMQRYGHPVARRGHHTLAWARIDLDLNGREALIEEIQTDWVLEAHRVLTWRGYKRADMAGHRHRIEAYVEHVLRPHAVMWDEAVLAAVIQMLRRRLKIRRIFYYDFETGNRCKGIGLRGSKPPRSLYTNLPRRLGFERSETLPAFLASEFGGRLWEVFKDKPPVFWQQPPAPDLDLLAIRVDPKKSARRMAG